MTNSIAIHPPLSELYKLIEKIPRFPVSNQQVVEIAAKIKAPKEVIDFYRSFDNGQIYRSKDELASSTEAVDIMRQAAHEMPKEEENAPEDY